MENPKIDLNLIKEDIQKLIVDLKLDTKISKEHLEDTADRVSRMYVNELFSSIYKEPPKLTTFINENVESECIVENIVCNSTCAHHFVPFVGHCSIMYMPGKRLVGLSKFSRVVKYFSRMPQIQEILTNQVCDYLNDVLEPKYIAVVMCCKHLCMNIRGVEDYNSYTTTSAIRHRMDSAFNLDAKIETMKRNIIKPNFK